MTPSQVELDRQSYRRTRTIWSFAIAGASTTLFVLVAGIAIVLSPGWDRVKESFLDVHVAARSWRPILSGLWLNVRVLLVAAVLVLALALVVALLRSVRGPVFFPLRALATAYVDIFRGIPLIIVLYIIGFGLPGLRLAGTPNNPVVLGTIAIVLVYSGYVAEVLRAGIESVHPSQRAAARSLGLTYAQTMRVVVLPQAFRRVLPALLNDFVALQKDVGLISILGAVDAVRQAQIQSAESADFTPYVVAGLFFLALAIPSGRFADWVAIRQARRQNAGAVL
ncbi:amino acid ABC transporter permease [Jatrophihabitans sp. YIM 134969]